MKKLLFIVFAVVISVMSFIKVSDASAVVRVDGDDQQVYELERSDYETIEYFFETNQGKKMEMWLNTDSKVLKEISDVINNINNEKSYLLMYHNEWSDDNSYLYSKIKLLPIY